MARRRARRQQRAAQKELDAAKKAWMSMEFTNPYEGIQNPYANLENVYEEQQVDTRTADYLKRQQQQSQADTLQGLKGVAGSSGVAGLAQTIANIGTKQMAATSQVLATQQERAETAKLTERSRLQGLRASGEYQTDMLRRKGEQLVQAQEQQRTANIYGLSMDKKMAANQAVQAANQQIWSSVGQGVMALGSMYGVGGSREGMWQQDWQNIKTGVGNWSQGQAWNYQPPYTFAGGGRYGYGSGIGADGIQSGGYDAGIYSDRKLKKNIKLIGKSPSGLNIYSFEYKNNSFGDGIYQGVMSNEVPSYAVISNANGYDMVDYSKIDVDFIKI